MSRGKPQKPKRFARKTTAKNLEAKFDAGEDVLDYFDLSAAKRIGRTKKPAREINPENQIEFHKRNTGGWDVTIHEPLASRVKQHCKARKIPVQQFVLESLSRA